MYTSEQILDMVRDYIESLSYTRKPSSLYAPIQYVLSAGGKRIRPVLMLLAYNLFRDNPQSILPTAVGLETYHNYTLLHDDLMDRAEVRRGRPTVHKVWGDNAAILSGDSMLVLAYERIAQCADSYLPSVLKCFTQTALEIGEGQQYDMEFETRDDVSEEEYIEMIRLKTSVLLAAAVKIGAILADASSDDQQKLYNFAQNVGLAFQLQDDYLDVYGDEAVFGKAIGGDICNNKKTYMLIQALRHAKDADYDELQRWISATDFKREQKIQAVTALYDKYGIRDMAQAKIDHYFAEAEKELAAVSVSDDKKHSLREYVSLLMHRNS